MSDETGECIRCSVNESCPYGWPKTCPEYVPPGEWDYEGMLLDQADERYGE